MTKLLYAMKIFLFRNQRDVFKLTKREESQLQLFSEKVTAAEKTKIVNGFTVEPGERRVIGDATLLKAGACLGDFSTKRTAKLLPRLQIKDSFLTLPPDM